MQAASEEQPQPGAAAAKSLWSVASALSATVKQRTAELAASIQETDWRSELTALQQGLKEDTGEMQERAKAATQELTHRAKAAAEQLPAAMEHLPETGAALQARAAVAGQQLQLAGRSLGQLSQRLVQSSTELFDQINTAVQAELAQQEGGGRGGGRAAAGAGGARYSRLDADVAAMQRDSGTYCDEPEDADDFAAWHETFDLASRKRDVDNLVAGNTFMSELQSRIVPAIVEYDLFWTRYFYRLHKLQQRHAQFAALTQRAEQGAALEEEDLGWGSDDDDVAEVAAAQNAVADEARAAAVQPEEAAGEAVPVARMGDADAADADPGPVQPEAGAEVVEAPAPETAPLSDAAEPRGPEAGRASLDSGAGLATQPSDGGSKTSSSWDVVDAQRSDQDPAEPPAAGEAQAVGGQEHQAQLPVEAATEAPPANPQPGTAEDAVSSSEFALGEADDDVSGEVTGAAADDGDESDWGEDAADWE